MNPLTLIPAKAWAWGAGVALVALASLATVQTLRLASTQADLAKRAEAAAVAESEQTKAVLADEQQTAKKEGEHAQATIEASDKFTQGEPDRLASLQSDLARVDRLRTDAERRAASYRAQAESNAAARRDIADRLATLDGQLVEGLEVVAELRSDLARRDAEVVLLYDQIEADRKLLEADSVAKSVADDVSY